jgi:hypothetical protein
MDFLGKAPYGREDNVPRPVSPQWSGRGGGENSMPLPRNHRQYNMGGMRGIMVNRLAGWLELSIGKELVPRVRIAVKAREVGAGDLDTEALAGLEDKARGP